MSAEIAFAGVEVLEIRKLSGERPFKFQEIYSAFMQCAQSLNQFIWPWLYLEPDCSPLKTGWLDTLATAYFNQPRRYLGLELKAMAPDGKSVTHNFISRTAIYPANAVLDLVSPSEQQNLPEHRFSHVILPRQTATGRRFGAWRQEWSGLGTSFANGETGDQRHPAHQTAWTTAQGG